MNFLTEIRLAIWNELDSDAAISAALGNGAKFKFSQGLRKRLIIERAVCPFISIVPAGSGLAVPSNAEREWNYELEIQTGTAGQDAEPCENLTVLVLERLMQPATSNFGMSSSAGFGGLRFGNIVFEPHPEVEGADFIWLSRMSIICRFRRRYD